MIVMVIDPNRNDLMKSKAYLERDGTEVVGFCDPMTAVQYAYNHKVDIVYTEVVMPHLHGYEAANILHKHSPAIQIYFLTDTDEFLQIGREHDISGYYLKPLSDLAKNNLLLKDKR